MYDIYKLIKIFSFCSIRFCLKKDLKAIYNCTVFIKKLIYFFRYSIFINKKLEILIITYTKKKSN